MIGKYRLYNNDNIGLIYHYIEPLKINYMNNIYNISNTGAVTTITSNSIYDSSANSTGGGRTISAGAMLYVLAQMAIAKHASNPALFKVAPYTTAIASSESADLVSHVTYLSTVA